MFTASALSGLMQQIPGLWGFALAALGLILSPVPVVWVSFHRRRVLLARIKKERFQIESEHEARMRELANEAVARVNDHAARMFALETDRQQMHLEAQLQRDFMLAERRPLEIELPMKRGNRHPQITAPETQGASA
ncbi:MAG TPA: hypothetical protein VGD66_04345 [Allosphingosinicella sp.]|jgi:hypothetical protein